MFQDAAIAQHLEGALPEARAGDEGRLPALDLEHHTKVADLVRQLVVGGLLAGVHDVGGGGLGVALAEMAVRSGTGSSLSLSVPVSPLLIKVS